MIQMLAMAASALPAFLPYTALLDSLRYLGYAVFDTVREAFEAISGLGRAGCAVDCVADSAAGCSDYAAD